MDYICTSCDYVGPQALVKPGSRLVEVLLWTVLLVPGPFYSIWRIMGKHYACPKCGERVMVPAVLDIVNKNKVSAVGQVDLSDLPVAQKEVIIDKRLEEIKAPHKTEIKEASPLRRENNEGNNEW